ncbi:hypothetical protein ABPG74_022678 [Tetrahymena malaccensis]
MNIQQMDQGQDGQNGQSEKKTRRTRKDQNDRNYNCGCGKSYLSYPALYTHLKQKHDGKPPEGTSLPGPQGKANSRGRPPKKEDGDQNNKEEEKSAVGSNEAVDVLEEILNFLDTIDKNYRRNKNDEWTEDNKLSDIFPIEFFQGKEETEYKAILDGIKQLENDPANFFYEEIDPKEEIKKTEMNRIFVLFLNYIAKGVQNDALREIMIFLCFYRKALNQYGWDALEQKINNELQQQNMLANGQNGDNPELNGNSEAAPVQQQYQIEQSRRQQEYCQINNGDDSFLICNDLVIEVLPNYFREYSNSNELFIIGPSDEQLKNAVYIIQHFANWLFASRYTNTKLVIKADDE